VNHRQPDSPHPQQRLTSERQSPREGFAKGQGKRANPSTGCPPFEHETDQLMEQVVMCKKSGKSMPGGVQRTGDMSQVLGAIRPRRINASPLLHPKPHLRVRTKENFQREKKTSRWSGRIRLDVIDFSASENVVICIHQKEMQRGQNSEDHSCCQTPIEVCDA
jgi:hypothetical protein